MNNKPTIEQLKELLSNMDSLTARLQDDYNGIKPFEQCEEDRTTAYNVCELLEAMIKEES